MNKQAQKRLKLFKVFSENLEWVKDATNNFTKREFKDGYICPICFRLFPIQNLSEKCSNKLTIEHVPPDKLGGSPQTLTCKECNSKSGYQLDNHLFNRLLELDFSAWLPGSGTDTRFKFDGNEMGGSFEIAYDGSVKIDLAPNRSHPDQAKAILKELERMQDSLNPFRSEVDSQTEMLFSPKRTSNERRAEIGLLRIAYLLAFSKFGYGFFINNPGLQVVRQQILNPDKNILSPPYWIKYDFPHECDGINVMKGHNELRCFLVIFSLKTKSTTRKYAIALPGHSEWGGDIYKNIEEILCTGDGSVFQSFIIDHIPNKSFTKKKEDIFASHGYWITLAMIKEL